MNKLIIPTNVSEEKEKFFSSSTYNPVFHYPWQSIKGDLYIPDDNKLRQQLYRAIYQQDPQAIIAAGKANFLTEITEDKLTLAKNITQKRLEPQPTPDAEFMYDLFSRVFSALDIHYNPIIVDEHGYNFRPHHSDKTFRISRHLQLSYLGIQGQVKHETVHIIRQINSLHNGIIRDKYYLSTEEGLASYISDYQTDDGALALYQHAVQYLATEISLRSTFRDTYNLYRDYGFPKNLAWQRALKNKQGLVNTAEPGDTMKLAMYFYHEQEMRQLEKSEIIRLMIGKISKNQLDDYPVYKGHFDEKVLELFLFGPISQFMQ